MELERQQAAKSREDPETIPPTLPQKQPAKYVGKGYEGPVPEVRVSEEPEAFPPALPEPTPPPAPVASPSPPPVARPTVAEAQAAPVAKPKKRRAKVFLDAETDEDPDDSTEDEDDDVNYYRRLLRSKRMARNIMRERRASKPKEDPYDMTYRRQVAQAKRDMLMAAVFGA